MKAREKQKLRAKIWTLLEKRGIARFPIPVKGRIPNYVGARKAALQLRKMLAWKRAKRIFCNPDFAQRDVREFALKDEKLLIVASPRLKKGLLQIDPKLVKGNEKAAATIRGLLEFGIPIKSIPKIDLVVQGSVAVDSAGNRLGKGSGYGDKEIKMLKSAGAIGKGTPIVTLVHDAQILERIPAEPHDEKINLIITPTRIVYVKGKKDV